MHAAGAGFSKGLVGDETGLEAGLEVTWKRACASASGRAYKKTKRRQDSAHYEKHSSGSHVRGGIGGPCMGLPDYAGVRLSPTTPPIPAMHSNALWRPHLMASPPCDPTMAKLSHSLMAAMRSARRKPALIAVRGRRARMLDPRQMLYRAWRRTLPRACRTLHTIKTRRVGSIFILGRGGSARRSPPRPLVQES